MARISRRDKAWFGAIFFVGVVGVFLAVLPELVNRHYLTWGKGTGIALGVTAASLVCSGVERHESNKADREREAREDGREKQREAREKVREKQEADRDKMMRKILKVVEKDRRTRIQHIFPGTPPKDSIELALDLYDSLSEDGMKTTIPLSDFARYIEDKNGVETMDNTFARIKARSPDSPFAKINWREPKNAEDIRNLAEALVFSETSKGPDEMIG
jgi:hypothetical protein